MSELYLNLGSRSFVHHHLMNFLKWWLMRDLKYQMWQWYIFWISYFLPQNFPQTLFLDYASEYLECGPKISFEFFLEFVWFWNFIGSYDIIKNRSCKYLEKNPARSKIGHFYPKSGPRSLYYFFSELKLRLEHYEYMPMTVLNILKKIFLL